MSKTEKQLELEDITNNDDLVLDLAGIPASDLLEVLGVNIPVEDMTYNERGRQVHIIGAVRRALTDREKTLKESLWEDHPHSGDDPVGKGVVLEYNRHTADVFDTERAKTYLKKQGVLEGFITVENRQRLTTRREK